MARDLSKLSTTCSPHLHLNDLYDVTRGFNPGASRNLYSHLCGSRVKSLALSKYKDVEKSYASSVNCLDVSQDQGRYLLSGGGDGSVVIFGISKPSNVLQQTFPVLGKIPPGSKQCHNYALSTCQFYPPDSGVFTTSAKDGMLKIWDTHQMQNVHKFTFPLPILDHNMSSVRSAKPLIAVSGMDKTTRICDLRTVSYIQTLAGHTRPITSVRWSRHSPTILATGGADGKIAFWDIRKAKSSLGYLDAENSPNPNAESNCAHNSGVISLEFAEDSNHLISCGADNRLRLWSTVTMKNTLVNYGKIAFDIRDRNRHFQMCLTKLSRPDLIFVPTEDKVVILDMFSGERVGCLMGHFGQVLSCAYHPGFQWLFSGATDRNILMWTPSMDYMEFNEEVQLNMQNQTLRSNRIVEEAKVVSNCLTADSWSDEES